LTDSQSNPTANTIDRYARDHSVSPLEESLKLRVLFDTAQWAQVRPIHGHSIEYRKPQLFSPHQHREGKLIYADMGAAVIATEDQRWAIAPGRALWICPGIRHWTRTVHHVRIRSVLIDRALEDFLPTTCRYISISPLLAELIKAVSVNSEEGLVSDRDKALAALLIHELNCTAA